MELIAYLPEEGKLYIPPSERFRTGLREVKEEKTLPENTWALELDGLTAKITTNGSVLKNSLPCLLISSKKIIPAKIELSLKQ